MAKIEIKLNDDFDSLLKKIEDGIIDGSFSATLEEESDFRSDDARCSVRVFERYSYAGGNRVSMSVTLFQHADEPVQISVITAGGSEAMFCKINTIGEETFLEEFTNLLSYNTWGDISLK